MSFRPKTQNKIGNLTMEEVKLMLQAKENATQCAEKLSDVEMARELQKRGYHVAR